MRTGDARSRIDGRRSGHFLFVHSLRTVAGRVEDPIEKRHRRLLPGVGSPHLQVISDFRDQGDEARPAVDGEANDAEVGASGEDANVVVVIPFLMSVLPSRMMRTPLPSSTMSRSGNASPP